MKGRFSISVVSEDLPKGLCSGEIRVRDRKLRKIVDRMEFLVPKQLLPGIKASFDEQKVDRRFYLNYKIKF